MRITNNTGHSRNPAIALSGSTLFLVWENDIPNNTEIYFKKSMDAGATWQPAKKLTNKSIYSISPAIAVSGRTIYLVWNKLGELYFRKSSDGGATWQSAQRITNNSGNSIVPTIEVNGLTVYLAWADYTPGNGEIYFGKSSDGGATWQPAARLTDNSGESFAPRLAISGAGVYLVWQDKTPGNYEIYLRKSTDGGATWKASQRLTKTPGYSGYSKIAVTGSSIFIVWSDTPPGRNSDIYLKYSRLQ
jgi:hypothetical protein